MLNLTKYHEKTHYYCVPAAIQSLLHTYFGGYTSGGIKAGQDAIAAATDTDPAYGTYNIPALNYVNAQLAKHTRAPSDWLYVNSSSTSATQLYSRVLYDVGYNWPLYVMVNWNSPYWPDHGSGAPIGHASMGFGWADPSTLDAYDPWSYLKADESCYVGDRYSASPNYACYLIMTSAKYYDSTLPVTYDHRVYHFNVQWY